jgi:hypothetical protein
MVIAPVPSMETALDTPVAPIVNEPVPSIVLVQDGRPPEFTA